MRLSQCETSYLAARRYARLPTIAADLRPSADGSTVRTALAAYIAYGASGRGAVRLARSVPRPAGTDRRTDRQTEGRIAVSLNAPSHSGEHNKQLASKFQRVSDIVCLERRLWPIGRCINWLLTLKAVVIGRVQRLNWGWVLPVSVRSGIS